MIPKNDFIPNQAVIASGIAQSENLRQRIMTDYIMFIFWRLEDLGRYFWIWRNIIMYIID